MSEYLDNLSDSVGDGRVFLSRECAYDLSGGVRAWLARSLPLFEVDVVIAQFLHQSRAHN